MSTSFTAAGPAAPDAARAPRRSLAPDLARGLMLLVIALVHAHMFVAVAPPLSTGYPSEGTVLDRTAAAVLTLLADGRGYPMFAALFGYGLARILARQEARGRGWPAARRLLRRRAWWLLAFGACHALLLFGGDILGPYGLLALLLVGLLRLSDRALLWTAAACAAVLPVLYNIAYTSLMMATGSAASGAGTTDPLTDAGLRIATWPITSLMFAVAAAAPFLVGMWAGRHRLLDHPERHVTLLRRATAVGISAAVLGGLPLAAVNALVWEDPSTTALIAVNTLHSVSGYLGGFGYAALIGLLAARFADRRGPVVTALAACGERSMTCYLLQSVAWMVLFTPYYLGVGEHVGVALSVAVAVAVWLTGIAVAEVLRRAGRRGPAEALLRRLAYGRPAAAAR
ncbi:DUF418 domain-containing protein [Marinitenerispora sediminis]|uniref:DUF418 domain-containing protein n=1 Tax=Marinitenerispora sediminis TaxID=1931232 RepID=UPI001F22217A|nr:DUF418 domain-containing protein [Marinitenerispora sediminis]